MVTESPQIANPEKVIRLSLLKERIPLLAEYMESSKAFHAKFGINLENAGYNESEKEFTFEVILSSDYQGHENVLAGGATSALLDLACAMPVIIELGKKNKKAVTGLLNIRFPQSLPPGIKYTCIGKMSNGPHTITGSIKDSSGKEYVSATCTMLEQKKE